MEVNTSIANAEGGSGNGRGTKVKALKDNEAKKMTVCNNSPEDSTEATSVRILSENKSTREVKAGSSGNSKSLSKAIAEGDLSNAGVNAELAKTKQSLATEASHPSERNSSANIKMPGITTVHSATKVTKLEKVDAIVSDETPERRSGHIPVTEKPDMRRTVEKWKKHAFKTGSRMNLYKVVKTVPSEYLARARGSEVIQPTVNGLRQFGISKGEISRVVVKFTSPPTPHPLTICFHFPSTFLTHRYVLDMIRALIQEIEDARVTSIQFIDRNTIHGARGLDNRWLVTVNMAAARDVILKQGLQLFNRRILVRKYDDILSEEYEEFLEYAQIKRRLYNKREDAAIKEELEDETFVAPFQSEQPDLSES